MPLITSNIPGNDELIKEGENGFLFNIEKPEELRDKILKLADDNELKNKISKSAESDVLNNYLISNYADRMEEFFVDIIK